MLLLREYSTQSLSENLGRTAFGLFVAGLVAWLIVLYWTAPFDFCCCTAAINPHAAAGRALYSIPQPGTASAKPNCTSVSVGLRCHG
jgi:hypothetical protein